MSCHYGTTGSGVDTKSKMETGVHHGGTPEILGVNFQSVSMRTFFNNPQYWFSVVKVASADRSIIWYVLTLTNTKDGAFCLTFARIMWHLRKLFF